MRVLQVHNHYRLAGGEDVVVDAEADLLTRAGHDVIQVLPENPPGWLRAAGALAASPWNPWAERRIRSLADDHRPDVAHVHNTWFALSPSVLRGLRTRGVPVVMTVHNYRMFCSNGLLFRDGAPCQDCVGSHPWHGVRHRCYRGSVIASAAAASTIRVNLGRNTWDRDTDLLLAPSAFVKQLLTEAGVDPSKIRLKPHFATDPGPRIAPPSRSSTVLFVGRLSHEKGAIQALEAWKRFGPSGLEMLVIGDGPLYGQLEAGAPPGVRLLGALPHAKVIEHMLAARALLFPSVWQETFGLVVVEAMAAGLPVLSSSIGAQAELVAPLGDAWLVTPGDPEAWASAMEILEADAAVDAAGARSREAYLDKHTPEEGLSRLEDAYRSVVRPATARDSGT